MTENQCKYLKLSEDEIGDKSPENSFNEWTVYPKDSFKRFGDDLSEVLLSYLSFEDKFRFECLSKQIQRLVFNKQTELLFGNDVMNRLSKKDIFDRNFIQFETMSQILKKCSNLRRISVLIVVKSMDTFMSSIIKYCHHLEAIEWSLQEMDENIIKEFCNKFGSQIKSIKITGNLKMETILRSCPNLESLDIMNSNRQLWSVFGHCQPFIRKLKSFSFNFTANDIKNIEQLVEYNKNTLQSIEVKISFTVSLEDINVLVTNLSKLSNLKRFLFNSLIHIQSSFVLSFKEIADNCPNIKEFGLVFENHYLSAIIPHFLALLNRFRQLKRLTFTTVGGNPPSIHSLKSRELIGCQQLTHLRINSREIYTTDEFFYDIDKYLPKLVSIDICSCFGFITTDALQTLSKLSNLTTIFLASEETALKLNKIFLTNLVINCPKLQSIRLRILQSFFLNLNLSERIGFDTNQTQ